jgi:hypothetical protein
MLGVYREISIESVYNGRLMKKARGDGLVYQPTYIDKHTGERKTASTWWVQYFVKGARFRESSNSRSRRDAEALLRHRLEAAAQGKPVGPNADNTSFEDLAEILINDYQVNGRRSVERVEDAIKHLRGFFVKADACQITDDSVLSYVRRRQEQGAAPATINRELSALRRALRLAHEAGKVVFRPKISRLPEDNARRDYFESDEYQAVLDGLPKYLRPVIQTAYVTGWRIKAGFLRDRSTMSISRADGYDWNRNRRTTAESESFH